MSTQNKEQRAAAMENATQQETHPAVLDFQSRCIQTTARGPRKAYLKVEDERRKFRMEARTDALLAWETGALDDIMLDETWKDGNGECEGKETSGAAV